MPYEIPIYNIKGTLTSFFLEIEPSGEDVWLRIEEEFAGRRVEEEMTKASLADLVSGGPKRNYDLLGLTFETDGGDMVNGTVGVGSGNQRFMVPRDDLVAAL